MRNVAAILLLASCAFAQKRPITHEDVWLMKRVGAPVVSPNGRWAVFSVTEPAYEEGKGVSDLWVVDLDAGTPARRLTNTRGGEGGAVFAPDSRRLLFSARREGDEAPQIYLMPLDGGEAQRVTNYPTGAFSPQWRPDGKAFLFQSRVFPDAKTEEDNTEMAADRKARKYNARVYENFPYRFWDRWLDELRPHVLLQDLEPGAKARDLLAGTRLAALPGFDGTRGLGDAEIGAIWAPSGAEILFVATANADNEPSKASTTHIFKVSASGGEPVAVTSGDDSYGRPLFSPDGRVLYVTHNRREEDSLYSLTKLARIAWPPSGNVAPAMITGDWDRSVSGFALSPDGQTMWMTAEEHGQDKLFRMPATGGAVQLAFEVKEGVYSGLAIPEKANSLKLVALWGSMTHPEDVVLIDANRGTHKLLTDFNAARIAQIDWQSPRHVWFTAKNGKRIHSLMVLPPGFDPARKYPLLLFPHGGPHNMTKDQFFVRWNYHLLTSPGYVLLMTNYTGSTGFGEQFAAAIHRDILRGPGQEIEEAADDAIKQFPFIDASRQAAAGGSYGGYLMNWFEGNSTRFKTLINHAGLTDNVSFWGSTDGASYWERRAGGPVWEMKGQWRDQNPAAYAANFRTPMLITHGEQDFRVPVSQAYEIYKLLKRRGVPTRLVIFPEENHWVQRGENARYHMQEVLGWLKKYLQ